MEILPFQLVIHQSRWIKRYVTILFLLVMLAIVNLPVEKIVMCIMLSGLWFFWRSCRHKYFHPGGNQFQQVIFANYSWLLKKQETINPVYLHSAVVWHWLVVMNFRSITSRQRHVVLLLPDSIDREQLRRLRVLLRYLPVYGLSTPE
ncbi:MAG: protein YgfX [Oceanicoccus sp.]